MEEKELYGLHDKLKDCTFLHVDEQIQLKMDKQLDELHEEIKDLRESQAKLFKITNRQSEEIINLRQEICKHENSLSGHGYFDCSDCGKSGRCD